MKLYATGFISLNKGELKNEKLQYRRMQDIASQDLQLINCLKSDMVGKMFNYHQAAAEPNKTQISIPFLRGEGENELEIYAFWRVTTQFSIPADQMQERLA